MFVGSNNPMIYVTVDEGVTYSASSTRVDTTQMKIHPTMAGWILGFDYLQVR